MRKYIKIKNNTLWHWEPKCPEYPGSLEDDTQKGDDIEIRYHIHPNDRLCPTCLQIEANEKVRLQSKEMLGDDDLM